MGNGSSFGITRTIYVTVGGKTEKIVFSTLCSGKDITDLLIQAAGSSNKNKASLRDQSGAMITISPTMPGNTESTPYSLTVKEQERVVADTDDPGIQHVLSEVSQQFNRAFKFEDDRSRLEQRIVALENIVHQEGMKVLEIDRCKKDIMEIKDQMFVSQRKMIDYNSLSSPEANTLRPTLKKIPSFQKYTLSQETVDYLKQPTFDIWHWEPNEMLSLLEHMYHELGLVKEFNINPIILKRWLLCIQENYRNNPFHNFRHCFCVTQMMYGIIHMCELWEKMSREDLGILITACVCHDLDHPGYNNTYQINARTELAVRYNDISPLENHHCAVAFQILSNPETNIFSNVDSVTFKRIRSGIIMLILATDMARHSEILDSFKTNVPNFDFTNEDHLNSMKMVMVKCCDISNEVRPFEVSEPWVDCLLEEYFNQSDREKSEGLPVAPFMDREKVTKPTAQIGFIKFVLIPMFDTVAKLFPKLDEVMLKPLKNARDRYEMMKAQTDEKSKTAT